MKSTVSPAMIAVVALMIAITTVFTVAVQVPIPATTGYVNFSDVAIYFTAFLFGPWVGFVAGGVGTALADLSLGYAQFAPLSFVAHGLEGLLAGYIVHRLYPQLTRGSNRLWRVLSALGWILGSIPFILFLVLFIVLVLVPLRALQGRLKGLPREVREIWEERSQIPGAGVGWALGTVAMLAGYLLGEALMFGWAPALVELPFNLLQNVVGGLVGIPLVLAVRRAYPPIAHIGRRREWTEGGTEGQDAGSRGQDTE